MRQTDEEVEGRRVVDRVSLPAAAVRRVGPAVVVLDVIRKCHLLVFRLFPGIVPGNNMVHTLAPLQGEKVGTGVVHELT